MINPAKTPRVQAIERQNGSEPLNLHDYLYNSYGQRQRHTKTDSSYTTYGYDNNAQLTSALCYNSGGTAIVSEQLGFGYDAGWNMSSRSVNGAGTTYSVDDRNQLTAVGTDSFTYDAHGNLTYWGASGSWQRTLSYDNENRLIRVEVSGYYIGDYKYDGLGRLRERVEQRWNGSSWVNSTNRYLYDGMLIVQERDGGNVPTVTYTRGKDLSGGLEGAGGIGGLLARTHGYSGGNWSTHSYYHADALGNVSYLVNSSQAMVANYKYDAYGRTITSSGTLASANVMRFSSKLAMDIASMGLYYYGYRFYEPNLQRWVNRDPLGEPGFEILRREEPDVHGDGSNLYTYLGNNPVTEIDAHGLMGYDSRKAKRDCQKTGGTWASDAEMLYGGRRQRVC